MRLWLPLIVPLVACTAHPTLAPASGQDSLAELLRTTTAIEERCGLPAQSLLHPDRMGNLEIYPVSVEATYPQFSCVLGGVDKAGLAERGIRVSIVGTAAADRR